MKIYFFIKGLLKKSQLSKLSLLLLATCQTGYLIYYFYGKLFVEPITIVYIKKILKETICFFFDNRKTLKEKKY